jgi:hypothetical protein
MKNLQINGLNGIIAYCEAKGLSKCFEAYANKCNGEYIFEIGFNANSGYVYLALEDGVTICSAFGNDVEYLVTDFDNGNETFFDDYSEALTYFENLNNG